VAQKVVVIGGVATGPKAAARLRRLDSTADITIVERDDLVSYAGCGTPYYIKGDITEFGDLIETPLGTPRDAMFFRKVKNIRVLTRTLAQAVDREGKVVSIVNLDTSEQQRLPYDKLVLATGGTPFLPPVPGIDLENVFTLRSPHDASAIRDAISPVEVKARADEGEDFVLLDVRGPAEYKAMRIEDPRVKLVPLGRLRASLDELPRHKEIIPLRKISLRGYEAQRILEGAGLDNVRFMDGGVIAWPYEIVTGGAE
jgi:NADPH-dependent 2,4-dienoyl-CoA reductase/sulfur reductase-like enzyme